MLNLLSGCCRNRCRRCFRSEVFIERPVDFYRFENRFNRFDCCFERRFDSGFDGFFDYSCNGRNRRCC